MILVTGAEGFIGSHLIHILKKRYGGEEIFELDKGNCDLLDTQKIKELPFSPRLIIHLAGSTDTSKRDQSGNYIATKNLIEGLKGLNPKTHFIYTSSQAVYSGRTDTNKPITSTTNPFPTNSYGKTKLEAEKILLKMARKKKFKLTIIRLPTTWGENPRKNSFLNFLRKLVDTDSLFSRLDWPGKIGLISVDDATRFIVNSSLKAPQKPRVISIAVQNLTLAAIFQNITTQKGKIYRQIKVPEFVWNLSRILRPYMKYFEPVLPTTIYNYFWRASIVVDSPLWCKVNLKGRKFS